MTPTGWPTGRYASVIVDPPVHLVAPAQRELPEARPTSLEDADMPDRICSIDGCRKRVYARGWCQMHYRRWRNHGDVNFVTFVVRDTERRFWTSLTKTETCWLWVGSLDRDGYGKFRDDDHRTVRAHRWAYERLVGPIPDGLTIDHLCRVRNCVNPAHMEPVTSVENVRRAHAATQRRST